MPGRKGYKKDLSRALDGMYFICLERGDNLLNDNLPGLSQDVLRLKAENPEEYVEFLQENSKYQRLLPGVRSYHYGSYNCFKLSKSEFDSLSDEKKATYNSFFPTPKRIHEIPAALKQRFEQYSSFLDSYKTNQVRYIKRAFELEGFTAQTLNSTLRNINLDLLFAKNIGSWKNSTTALLVRDCYASILKINEADMTENMDKLKNNDFSFTNTAHNVEELEDPVAPRSRALFN